MAQEQQHPRIVAVYPDHDSADDAASAAQAAGASNVNVDSQEDRLSAVRGEMRQEGADGRPGFFTPKMMRVLPYWTLIAAVAGGAIALLSTAMVSEFAPGARLLMVVLGVLTGATIGFLLGTVHSGQLFRMSRRQRHLAGEGGTVVGADETADGVAGELGVHDPIRMDRISPSGAPEETVMTEHDGRRS